MKIAWKWVFALIYAIIIFIITPYLPNLIRDASSRWSIEELKQFVLIIEIIVVFFLLFLGIILFISRRKKSAILFLICIGGIFLLSFILYSFLPNPYEFTHLPEYAILSILIMRAWDKNKDKINTLAKNSYFLSGLLTGIIGTGDEIYQHFLSNRTFTWYDIFLNVLGGILGLLVYWVIKK